MQKAQDMILRHKPIGVALCLIAMSALAFVAEATAKPAHIVSSIPLMTRLVAIYLEHETQLMNALINQDRTTLEGLVDERFERTEAGKSEPDLRDHWIAKSGALKMSDVTFESMSVRDYGDIKIVNFVLRLGTSEKGQALSIVDVFKEQGDHATLMARFEAPLNQPKN